MKRLTAPGTVASLGSAAAQPPAHAAGPAAVPYGPVPPPRYEPVPPPRQVLLGAGPLALERLSIRLVRRPLVTGGRATDWIPGHWRWNGYRYVWVPAHWG